MASNPQELVPMGNESIDTIMSRRSVRKFTGEKVPEEDIKTILKAAMAAPSAVNVQPWSFIVVQDEELLGELANRLPHAKMLAGAGTGIIVLGHPEKDDTYAREYWVQDCSAASMNILLAAKALGYGTVWTGVYPDGSKVDTVREVLNIPDDIIPLNVIPIGFPAEEGRPRDKFNEGNISWDMY